MIKRLFNPEPLSHKKGIAVIRIICGALVIYHGQEIFHQDIMDFYLSWKVFSVPSGKFMVYFGKTVELTSGLLLLFGMFTRLGSILLMGAMLFITFKVGEGRFWYEEQHPFLFALIALSFFFSGPGAWSVDQLLFRKKE